MKEWKLLSNNLNNLTTVCSPLQEHRMQAVEQGQQVLGQGQQTLEQGQRSLEREIVGVKQAVVDSQARIIQWVIGLFFGSTVVVATLAGVYISVLLAR